ncbi:hypothetical protein AX774_g7367 [Zancudomyces culisetae]|uniref:Uncharacterized protein n=1 Tax=Zancudomyces culisetae TaxID=1213189 RepID=A0A1R1PE37_ZANCU|nr:hypothetical protein AX774_g7367 [Zancudomyces culisetae]|eukprot:OMH79226.1 hypothetical protein AX774_g7367 [Zancudomyces culisetae]
MKNRSTGFSPSEMLYGVKMQTSSTWMPPAEIDNIEEEILQSLRVVPISIPKMREKAMENNAKSKSVISRDTTKCGPGGKFDSIWKGPYKIIKCYTKGVYLIKDPDGNMNTVNGDRLKAYKYSERMVPEVVPSSLRTKIRIYRN